MIMACFFAIVFPPISIALTYRVWRILRMKGTQRLRVAATGCCDPIGFLIGFGLMILGYLPAVIFAIYLIVLWNSMLNRAKGARAKRGSSTLGAHPGPAASASSSSDAGVQMGSANKPVEPTDDGNTEPPASSNGSRADRKKNMFNANVKRDKSISASASGSGSGSATPPPTRKADDTKTKSKKKEPTSSDSDYVKKEDGVGTGEGEGAGAGAGAGAGTGAGAGAGMGAGEQSSRSRSSSSSSASLSGSHSS
jgi:uncharacterized membrane protein YqaE (UPF0057 family)